MRRSSPGWSSGSARFSGCSRTVSPMSATRFSAPWRTSSAGMPCLISVTRPIRPNRPGRVTEIKHGIPALDVLQGAENRVADIGETVREHPLNLADPDDHPGELRRVGVQFEPEHDLGSDARELHGRLQSERTPQDGLSLKILQGLQG